MEPATNARLTVNGLSLNHYVWPGDGLPVVCLHGTSYNARMWDGLANDLAPRYRLIGLDQRGHGESQSAPDGQYAVDDYAADVAAFVDALGLRRFHLIGFSLGSRVALEYAAHHGANIDRLIFLDLSFDMPRKTSDAMIAALRARPKSFADFDEALAYARTFPDRALFDEATHRRVLAADLATDVSGRLAWRCDLDAVLETLRVGARDMWTEVRQVPCPTLVLRGQHSTFLPKATAERLPHELAHGAVVTIPRAGHLIWADNARATSAAIRCFLDGGEFDAVRVAVGGTQ